MLLFSVLLIYNICCCVSLHLRTQPPTEAKSSFPLLGPGAGQLINCDMFMTPETADAIDFPVLTASAGNAATAVLPVPIPVGDNSPDGDDVDDANDTSSAPGASAKKGRCVALYLRGASSGAGVCSGLTATWHPLPLCPLQGGAAPSPFTGTVAGVAALPVPDTFAAVAAAAAAATGAPAAGSGSAVYAASPWERRWAGAEGAGDAAYHRALRGVEATETLSATEPTVVYDSANRTKEDCERVVFRVPGPGTLAICIDNAGSWIRGKTARYYVRVAPADV